MSPRSFLAAIRKAAEDNARAHPAIHWSGLQEGVRHASRIRVSEIEEDMPWAHDAMSALHDLVVPCTKAKLVQAWKDVRRLETSRGGVTPLPRDDEEILSDLRRTGMLKVLPDGRINIPDVYRVGYGLRRKGGFAPRRG